MINVIGGALTRLYLLNKMSVASAPVLSTTALEKLLATVVLAALSAAGLIVLHPRFAPHLPMHADLAGGAILALLLVAAAVVLLSRRVRRSAKAVREYAEAVMAVARALVGNRRALVVAILLTGLSQLMVILIGGALTVSLWAEAPALSVMLVLPPTMLLAGLPISVGGWGVREFSIMVALGMLGASPDVGLLVSLLIYASTLGGIVIAAALMLPVHLRRPAALGAS
jgi:uncharacterized membrane protein YbhN (UPF0104 family)